MVELDWSKNNLAQSKINRMANPKKTPKAPVKTPKPKSKNGKKNR
jgi:hypothetical protein